MVPWHVAFSNCEEKIVNIAQASQKIFWILQNRDWFSFFSFYPNLLWLRMGNLIFFVRKNYIKLKINHTWSCGYSSRSVEEHVYLHWNISRLHVLQMKVLWLCLSVNARGKKFKILQNLLRPENTTYIFSAWAKRLRVLPFLVTYRNAAVVGNLETAVCALWHPVCIWVWARQSPNPSERRGISFFALLFLHCSSGLLTLGIKSVMFLHISIVFISICCV